MSDYVAMTQDRDGQWFLPSERSRRMNGSEPPPLFDGQPREAGVHDDDEVGEPTPIREPKRGADVARAEPVPLHSPMPSELGGSRGRTPAGGIKTLSWPEIIAQPPDPPPTIRPGVPEVGVAVLAGAPKVGKTLLASQWALESGRSTLLVIEEGSLAGISYRLRRQADALGIVEPQVHLALRNRLRLDDPEALKRLRDWIDWEEIKLVVLDPLNRLHGADENRPSDMTRVMDAMAELAYGVFTSVLAIHHLSKPSAERRGDIWDRFRGASSIRSGTDANLVMDATGDTVHLVGEFRDAEPLSEWMELDRDTLTFRPTDAPEAVVKVDPTELRTFVEGRGQVVGKQVMDQFGVTKVTALRALRALGCDEYVGLRNTLTFSLGVG